MKPLRGFVLLGAFVSYKVGERLLKSINESSVLNRSTFKGGEKMGKRNVSAWNRKGVMMGYILLTMVVSLSLWIMPLLAVSMTLKPYGTWSAVCKTGFLQSHKFDKTTSKNTYTFRGECTENIGDTAINRWYTINASWNGSTHIAVENLAVTFTPGSLGGGSHTGSISCSCPDDPWINTVNCELIGKNGNIFELEGDLVQPIKKYPISADVISSSQKQSLKTELATKGAFLATPQAPVILSPSPNQKFSAPAQVLIKVQHNPNYDVAFQFQRGDLVSKPNFPNLMGNVQIVLSNKEVHDGITTGYLSINKSGRWRVRARCIFPNGNAPWSEWREFVVKFIG
jgi:hypothetical protein